MKACKVIVLGLFLCGLVSVTKAEEGVSPPLGSWSGSGISFTLNRDGTYVYRDPGTPGLVGNWTWSATTHVGGVLTLHYTTRVPNHVFNNKLYFGVTWINSQSITFSDPAGNKAVLYRQ